LNVTGFNAVNLPLLATLAVFKHLQKTGSHKSYSQQLPVNKIWRKIIPISSYSAVLQIMLSTGWEPQCSIC